ncbi:chemotaxis protein CheW [Enterococcus columbae]|uniref:CheW-like domain-containing protein n=1 Tax=Enterococcus columbae DSM 7374 = ATCC 51263 TaxID=1121865 RepID=S1NUV1_9ENTE|nr:chemotaxis protein CheW [Enterococcus columbae]EOT39981.1 hypothetical protein OMW_01770 [Enterococcus columbae DSM 7374 = ATCC 51263]EOW83966.1 hypothetical protein I568_01413 [Enterococcus columbae DSM 7374 = ATCC 51263]OJG25815.1 hypothetical protein RR47_GL001321 [Enterococcus columbae DSM 7374 = ATCC 51263]
MQMILFQMNQQHFLISADSVEEVIDTVKITDVPLAPRWIEGLINLRGTVLTVVNLSRLIGMDTAAENRNILIMKQNDERKGLLIEEVIEVIDIQEEDIQLNATEKFDYYSGIVKFKDQIANIITVNHLIFD